MLTLTVPALIFGTPVPLAFTTPVTPQLLSTLEVVRQSFSALHSAEVEATLMSVDGGRTVTLCETNSPLDSPMLLAPEHALPQLLDAQIQLHCAPNGEFSFWAAHTDAQGKTRIFSSPKLSTELLLSGLGHTAVS